MIYISLEQHGLNCTGPPTCGFFSIVNTTVLPHHWLVESEGTVDMQALRIQRAAYKLYANFQIRSYDYGSQQVPHLQGGPTGLRPREEPTLQFKSADHLAKLLLALGEYGE